MLFLSLSSKAMTSSLSLRSFLQTIHPTSDVIALRERVKESRLYWQCRRPAQELARATIGNLQHVVYIEYLWQMPALKEEEDPVAKPEQSPYG
uniref:Uncharacterized protein n=1 Tax=Utricularia reniformis TaxID=192314 RepID=A0A1Y0B1D5_9LAMI|nr:hypothetical protein AEK19_MT0975 [Utricularia reniformis]ART31198.1 hypothetical protein AEK19_MT0975 [Utricularia reniformis]